MRLAWTTVGGVVTIEVWVTVDGVVVGMVSLRGVLLLASPRGVLVLTWVSLGGVVGLCWVSVGGVEAGF